METRYVDRLMGNPKFFPPRIEDKSLADKWMPVAWAYFIDGKTDMTFQEKDPTVRVDLALLHFQTIWNTKEVPKWRRLLNIAYLCGLWFQEDALGNIPVLELQKLPSRPRNKGVRNTF